ncbi:UNKNOWN [Stylonychia lemnae]|uniref:Uncharacterized protein n=1 Tax=Stylonychia lemnae TaxID=5949 RepID=A0A077ZW36_STYLE|nr:UNKNOWN [Stylonychia lemnae]|eukprot:CDW74165.1 UNKNOWN [Stylonychia lemnae]
MKTPRQSYKTLRTSLLASESSHRSTFSKRTELHYLLKRIIVPNCMTLIRIRMELIQNLVLITILTLQRSNSPPPQIEPKSDKIDSAITKNKKQNPYNKAQNMLENNSTNKSENNALKLINPHKFIQQNNFIPVPPINNGSQQKPNMGIYQPPSSAAMFSQPISFYPSGENITQHKIPSRQEQRQKNLYVFTTPLINNSSNIGGPFQEALMREKTRGLNSSNNQNNNNRYRDSTYLTEEQKFIIDQASEEQGNSDGSLSDRIVNISQEFINRQVDEEELRQSVTTEGDVQEEVKVENDDPYYYQNHPNKRLSGGNSNILGAVKANHKLKVKEQYSPYRQSQARLSKNSIRYFQQVPQKQIQSDIHKNLDTEASYNTNSKVVKRTIFTNNNGVQRRQSPQNLISSSNTSRIQPLAERQIYQSEEPQIYVETGERLLTKTPMNMHHQRLNINTSNQGNYKDLIFIRSRSHSKGNGQKRIRVHSNNNVININSQSQLSNRSRSGSSASSQSINTIQRMKIEDQNAIMTPQKMTLSPGATFQQRGRKIIQNKNPQYISPNRNSPITQTQSTPQAQPNFGFTLQGSNTNLINHIVQDQHQYQNEQQQLPSRTDRIKQTLKNIISNQQQQIEEQCKNLPQSTTNSNNQSKPKFILNKKKIKLKPLDSYNNFNFNHLSLGSQRAKRDYSNIRNAGGLREVLSPFQDEQLISSLSKQNEGLQQMINYQVQQIQSIESNIQHQQMQQQPKIQVSKQAIKNRLRQSYENHTSPNRYSIMSSIANSNRIFGSGISPTTELRNSNNDFNLENKVKSKDRNQNQIIRYQQQ